MSTSAIASAPSVASAAQLSCSRLAKDEDGTTAVEFGLIAVPFVTMLVGIIGVCLYFFTVLELDNAVWNASRDIRTGIYNTGGTGKGANAYPVPTDPPQAGLEQLRIDAFKKNVCAQLRDQVSCTSNLRVVLKSIPKTSVVSIPSCKQTNGSIIASGSNDVVGDQQFVVVTACYAWEFGGNLPFFKIGNLPDGSFLVQAMNAFVTEPSK